MQRNTKNKNANFRPKSSEEQKTKGHLADVQFSAQNQVNSKKRSSRPQAPLSAETSQNFRVSMIRHVFTVENAEKEDIWAFFNLFGGQIIFVKKENMSSERTCAKSILLGLY